MLLQFSVSNFRSFKEKATLNMINNNTNIKVAVFMGANASGKSNFFKAMHISKTFINSGVSKTDMQLILYDTYLKNNNVVIYEYLFKQKNYYINYSFSIKDNNNSIHSEKLKIGERLESLELVYSRQDNSIKVNENKNDELYKRINAMNKYFSDIGNPPNILFLTMILDRISSNTNEINLIKEFFDNLHTSDINAAVGSNENINIFPYLSVSEILDNEHKKRKFIKFLKIADSSINDIKINKKDIYNTIIHEIDGAGEINIDYSEESGGVKMFTPLFPKIDSMLKESKIYVIDELDIRLHYDLLSFLIEEINKNENGSQLIFSCHNIGALYWNIDNSCFNIVEKENGISKLIKISNTIQNTDERIKAYMKGKLGGFPDYYMVEESLRKYKEDI